VNAYPEPRTRGIRSIIVGAMIWAAMCPLPAIADDGSANPTTMKVALDGTIRIDLTEGAVEIVGVADDKITVSWRSRSSADVRDVSVRLKRSDAKNSRVMVDGPANHIRYRIEVPQQSNVAIHMRAGDLEVQGILGSVDADLLAGRMNLRVAEPRHYHTVSASVTVGALSARSWNADKGGFWRSFDATGAGDYDLRARVLAGQLTIRSE
jgi:hypothetical protein